MLSVWGFEVWPHAGACKDSRKSRDCREPWRIESHAKMLTNTPNCTTGEFARGEP